MFLEVVNRKKVTSTRCVSGKKRGQGRSYRADNTVDDATINFPAFVLPELEGAVLASIGTWVIGLGIERLALPFGVRYYC